MTYCVGLLVDEGLVMLADTRTNAGVDHIATFSKMHVVERPGERMICLMSAGNLAITQAVVNLVIEGFATRDGESEESLETVLSMFRAAELVGEAIRSIWRRDGKALGQQGVAFDCSFLVGGQIDGRALRLFQIYPAGNFIAATPDTAFLQVGEHKYGKPILDRAANASTPLNEATKLALISMDSTLRSNLTVGMPLDLLVYRKNDLRVTLHRRIEENDPYFQQIRETWSNALREAYVAIPLPEWALL